MGFLSKALGGVAGSLVSGLFGKSSAKDQMDFQKEMSNTSYQRAVKDMRAAGINPMLAAKVGGASTPGGASWQMPDMGNAVSSAVQSQRVQAETENVKKQGQVLDKEVEGADAMERIYKKYPWIRVARELEQTSAASLGAAKLLDLSDKITAQTSSSAKSFGTKTNRFKGVQPIIETEIQKSRSRKRQKKNTLGNRYDYPGSPLRNIRKRKQKLKQYFPNMYR